MEICGELPTGDVILASCDSLYYKEHAQAFFNSAIQHGNKIHIHVINPDANDIASLVFCKDQHRIHFSWTYEFSNIRGDPKPYYASNRFLLASYLIGAIPNIRLMLTDIDCLVNVKIPFPDKPLGLFLREYEQQEIMKVAAGLVYIGHGGATFIHRVADKIHDNQLLYWFVDQIALWTTYKELTLPDTIMKFRCEHMDWEYIKPSWIYTGKGPRKYRNHRYIEMKKNYERYKN